MDEKQYKKYKNIIEFESIDPRNGWVIHSYPDTFDQATSEVSKLQILNPNIKFRITSIEIPQPKGKLCRT